MTIYTFEYSFSIWNQSVVHVQLYLLLPDLHTGFSRGRSGGLVFPLLSEFSTVYYHPHKGFRIVNKTEIDVFLELSCFFNDPAMLAIWSLVPLPFLKPPWTSASSQFTYCWSLAWRILSITLLALWDECNCAVVSAFFEIAFLWDWNENWPFPVLWPLPSSQILGHIECSTFTVSSFRIWNSSTGILSPPLALFIVMLSKAHLTSHSRMSGSRWVITPSWLTGLWRSFLYSSFVYSCHLLLIYSASVRSLSFLLLSPSLHKMFPWYPLVFSWRDP